LEWGEQEAWLREIAEDGDEPAALAAKPVLPPFLEPVWSAFWALSGDRQVFMGGVGQIPFASIDRYAGRYGPDCRDGFEAFHALIRRLDAAYVQWAAEKAKKP